VKEVLRAWLDETNSGKVSDVYETSDKVVINKSEGKLLVCLSY